MQDKLQLIIFVSYAFIIITFLLLIGIYLNTRKSKIYSKMQVRILTEIAKNDGVEIDLNEIYKEANG